MLYLLHQTVVRAAARNPEHPAIRFRNSSLTYGELHRRSNQLAHVLVERGVIRGDRVGIYGNKSLETAVAIYGVMKAGAAYVPLDPFAPVRRTAKILRDCGIRHLITEEPKRAALMDLTLHDVPLEYAVGLEPSDDLKLRADSWETIWQAPETDPQISVTEQDLAYVIYTSGSTGDPKGIMHTHRSALAFAEVAASTYDFAPSDRVSNHAPLHFDLSTMDYFSTAVAGATTVLIPEEYTRMPASLSDLMQKEELTVFYTAPLAMIQLCLHGALEKRNLSTLRWMLFGGEPFPTKHLRTLMGLLPQAKFSNVYGPTEVNGCTYYLVPPLAPDSDEPIPIGGLYRNVEALVVSPEDEVVPRGTQGELLIRSATRMVGYWGQPQLTAASTYRRLRFPGCEDLFHRTGDLVEELPSGQFKFLGRKDRQIKTRGHRVELDEIEVALLTHPQVEEAAVYAIPDGNGSQRVEAGVLLTDRRLEAPKDLNQRMREELPPYALPSRIEIRTEFPRTRTGKIDRRLLREEALEKASQS